MSYFKARRQERLRRPATWQVLLLQSVLTVSIALLGWLYSRQLGMSLGLGGFISVGAQAFYNYQALRHFGNPDTGKIIVATYSAMWGKWIIMIAACLGSAIKLNELNAGALYTSAFFVHIVGAFLLPVYVKRVA